MFFEVLTPAYRTEIVRSRLKKFSTKFYIYCVSFNIQKLVVLENQRVKNTKKKPIGAGERVQEGSAPSLGHSNRCLSFLKLLD